jgi:uncharacterized protein
MLVMDKGEILKQTDTHVRSLLSGEGSGHDWWHVDCVRKTALHIAKEEKADLFIVELGALLHDIADWKFHKGDDSVGPRMAREWLQKLGVDEQTINHVCEIIKDISFKGAGVKTAMKTKEGMIVQDADRIQALGAIGVARCFAYGGSKAREIYNPDIKPTMHQSFEQYKSANGTSLNHFYEKLLLLKDRMNTAAGKKIAEKRHAYMEQFLEQFYKEWNGQE